jgi:hypothetical protein
MATRCRFPGERAIAHVKDLAANLPDLAAGVRADCRKSGLRHAILNELVDGIADNSRRVATRG